MILLGNRIRLLSIFSSLLIIISLMSLFHYNYVSFAEILYNKTLNKLGDSLYTLSNSPILITGSEPAYIDIIPSELENKIYVTNTDSNTLSIISDETHKKIKDIGFCDIYRK